MFQSAYSQDLIQKFKYRSYISTRLAKVLLSKKDIPDNNIVEECDGSGWITHGDGHRTPCPGCPACKSNEQTIKAVANLNEPEYYFYHFGSKSCVPCQLMKSNTWENQQLKDLMQQKKVKLVFFDDANPEDQKFFSFYQAKYYPTVVLLKADDLNKTINRVVGFQNHETMIKILETNL